MIQRFIAELQRRKVLRVGSGYVVGAWIVLQVALALQTAMKLPDSLSGIVLTLLIVGFPIALILSWFFEVTSEGVRRTTAQAADAPLVKPQTTDLALAGGLLLVAVVTVVQLLTPAPSTTPTPTTTAQAPPADVAPPALGDKSIAVLPFANLSPDKENEYFADGLTEELLSLLARISGLKVISRTSSFAFKDKTVPLRDIAKQLGVRHILEGTVRAAGDDLRVTVQLIDASSDTHLWSETYERKLENVFALQQDMARDIAGALDIEIKLSGGIDAAPTKSLEAYRLYLEGLNLVRGRDEANYPRARQLFEQAIKADRHFAEPHVAMAKTYVARRGLPPTEDLKLAQAEAEAALKLKPSLASARAVFGHVDRLNRNWEPAVANLERAIALDPVDTDARLWLGGTQLTLGYIDSATGTLEDLRRIDPLFVLPSAWLMWAQRNKGNDAAAEKLANELTEIPVFAPAARCELATFAYDRGDAAQAESHYLKSLPPEDRDRPFVAAVVQAMRSAAARPAAMKAIGLEAGGDRRLDCARMIFRSYDWFLSAPDESGRLAGRIGGLQRLWAPRHKALWSNSEFRKVLMETGIVAYWRKHGWPDHCRAKGDDDFECS